jgi:uncharacterized membrane protein YbhN (UPF0104 family)
MNSFLARVAPLYERKGFRRVFQIIWISLIVLFILVAVFSQWDTIRQIDWTADRLAFIGLALILTLLRRLAGGLRWYWIVRLLGNKDQDISLRQSLKIYFVANLATYIPGTYWFIPGRMVMSSKHGMSALQTGVSTLLEHFLLILSGALLGLLGLQLMADLMNSSVQSFWWIVLVIVVGLLAIHPRALRFMTNIMARALKMQLVEINVSYAMLLLHLLWSIVIWLLGALSLLFLAKAFILEIGLDQLGIFSAIFAVSWLIGFFTPFAPSGIGVREGVIGLAFTALNIPLSITVLLAALSRILIVFEDVFWALVGMRL